MFNGVVPGQRAPNQKLVNFPAREKFIELIDDSLECCGYADRSKFIRDAIAEKLIALNIPVPPEFPMAPQRAKVRYSEPSGDELNDKPGSKKTDESAAKPVKYKIPRKPKTPPEL